MLRSIKTNILFKNSALDYALKLLNQAEDYVVKNIRELNNARYYLVEGLDGKNYGILFHREFFQKFGEYARQNNWVNPETGTLESGLGECINVEHLRKFVSNKVKEIIYVYPDKKVYKIHISQIITQGHRRVQKEGTEVINYSIHYLQRIGETR